MTAHLAATATLPLHDRATFGRLAFLGTGSCLASLALAVSGDGSLALGALALGAVVLGVALATRHRLARARRVVDAMIAGDRWVRWHYDAPTWRAFEVGEQRRQRRHWHTLAWVLAALALLTGLLSVAVAGLGRGLLMTVFLSVGLLLLGGSLALADRWLSGGRAGAAAETDRQCLIGPRGMYFCGVYREWTDSGSRLLDARVLDDVSPAVLRLRFRESSDGPDLEIEHHVPIPAGQVDEARAVVRRLGALTDDRSRAIG